MAATFDEAVATAQAEMASIAHERIGGRAESICHSDSTRLPDEFFQDWFEEQARA